LLILSFYFVFFGLELIIGTKRVSSIVGIPLCSATYWGLIALRIILVLITNVIFFKIQHTEFRILTKYGYSSKQVVTPKIFFECLSLGLISGFMIGVIGVGTGLVFPNYLVYR
jgi:hypothetical protein